MFFKKRKLFEKEKISTKILRILLNILVGVLIGLIIILIFFFIFYLTVPKMNFMNKEFNNVTGEQIVNIAYNISHNRPYELNIYDCKNFSRDLKSALELIGLKPYCVTGMTYDGSKWGRHQWIELNFNGTIVPIEATSGNLILNLEYKSTYKIIDKGYCF